MPGACDDGGRYVASTMGLVKGQGLVVFVDPGFVADRALIFEAWKSAQVHLWEVTHVFFSPPPPDHTVTAALFPHATIVDFWATYKADLWEDHGDNFAIAPGIRVRRTPEHTLEDASLVVETAAGTVVFTHVWWNETLFPPIDPIAEDDAALEASRQLVESIADCIVPGHGTMVANPARSSATCSMVRSPAHGYTHGHGSRHKHYKTP